MRLHFRPPLHTHHLVDYFGRRAIPGVEQVVDGAYRRSLKLEHGDGVIELRAQGDGVALKAWLDDQRDADLAEEQARALFDCDADPEPAAARLSTCPLLGPMVRELPGMRVPGVVDGTELAIRAVLGQQVSLAGAATLGGRLVERYGRPLANPVDGVTHVFPSPAALADADPSDWPMPQARARALQAVCSAGLPLQRGADSNSVRRALLALPGIGPWTTEYVAMRALRDPDVFLPTDLGVRHALERLDQDPDSASELAETWRPYRSYAVQHLWASLGEA